MKMIYFLLALVALAGAGCQSPQKTDNSNGVTISTNNVLHDSLGTMHGAPVP